MGGHMTRPPNDLKPTGHTGVLRRFCNFGKLQILCTVAQGGFSTVYHTRDGETGMEVALKIDSDPIEVPLHLLKPEYASELKTELCKHFQHLAFMTEVETYASLQAQGLSCVPTLIEAGLIRLRENEIHSYMVMKLLGRCTFRAAGKCTCHEVPLVPGASQPCLLHDDYAFFQVAQSMLSALKQLHDCGLVHRDVKPGNFCLPHPSTLLPGVDKCRACIIDLGFVHKAPKPGDKGGPIVFVGTPDYASCAALNSGNQSARDDLESLGYALLEMYLGCGTLPWDITAVSASTSKEGHLPPHLWTPKVLSGMAKRKAHMWHLLTAVHRPALHQPGATGGAASDAGPSFIPAQTMMDFGAGVVAPLSEIVPGFLKVWIDHTQSKEELNYGLMESLLSTAAAAPPENSIRNQRRRLPTPVTFPVAEARLVDPFPEEVGETWSPRGQKRKQEWPSFCGVASNACGGEEGTDAPNSTGGSSAADSCWGAEAAAAAGGVDGLLGGLSGSQTGADAGSGAACTAAAAGSGGLRGTVPRQHTSGAVGGSPRAAAAQGSCSRRRQIKRHCGFF